MKKRFVVVVLAGVLGALAHAPGASAAFHLMKVSEVNASGGASFVELQMFAPGQQFVHNHSIFVYNATGLLAHTYTMPADLGNGANQATVLIGDAQVAGAFGVTPDFVDPDLGLDVYAAGGAVCFADAEPADCVAWGNFAEQGGFPDPAAAASEVSPAGLPLAGSSLTRSIARSCPTLLDAAADDTGASSADFALAAPTPRPNPVPPSERSCGPAGGGGGASGPGAKRKCRKRKARKSSAHAAHAAPAEKKKGRKKCKPRRGKRR